VFVGSLSLHDFATIGRYAGCGGRVKHRRCHKSWRNAESTHHEMVTGAGDCDDDGNSNAQQACVNRPVLLHVTAMPKPC
jgi:hypothetical protein